MRQLDCYRYRDYYPVATVKTPITWAVSTATATFTAYPPQIVQIGYSSVLSIDLRPAKVRVDIFYNRTDKRDSYVIQQLNRLQKIIILAYCCPWSYNFGLIFFAWMIWMLFVSFLCTTH